MKRELKEDYPETTPEPAQDRKNYPDEKGTESVGKIEHRLYKIAEIARTIPMKRELKAREGRVIAG